MSNVNEYTQSFAGGEVGDLMVGRLGVDSYQASGALVDNWMPLAQGPMTRRNGMEYIDSWIDSPSYNRDIKFEFDIGENYILSPRSSGGVLGGSCFRVYTGGPNGGPLLLPESHPGAFGSFSDASGTTSSAALNTGATATGTYGEITLTSVNASSAVGRFSATINDANVIHAVAFYITAGGGNSFVTLNIGTVVGGSDLGQFTDLRNGYHQVAFIPTNTGPVYFQFSYRCWSYINIQDIAWVYSQPVGTGPVPYSIMPGSIYQFLNTLRIAKVANRMWCFDDNGGFQPQIIERRGAYSWSVINFDPIDGPFNSYGDSSSSFAASTTNGNPSLSISGVSLALTSPLLRLFQEGQGINEYAASDGYYTNPILVTGLGIDREFKLVLDLSALTGTVTLQRSTGDPNLFKDVLTYSGGTTSVLLNDAKAATSDGATSNALYTASVSTASWDNVTAYYRLAITPANYTSGSANLQLSTKGGSTVGVLHGGVVVQPLANTGSTNIWQMGVWGTGNWPSCGCFGKGRLWTATGREVISSNSDDYFSFTDGIVTNLGSNAAQTDNTSVDANITSQSAQISWLACLDYLCIGTRKEENVAHSNVPTEAMGPTTFVADFMTQAGGASIDPLVLSYAIIFAHRTKRRLFMFAHNLHSLSDEAFTSTDLTRLHPEMALSGIVRFDATEEPERRIHVVLGDGSVRPLLFRREESINAWSRVTTTIGQIINVMVLHEQDEDEVYYRISSPDPAGSGNTLFTLVKLHRELPVNPWDYRYLDNHVTTPITQGAAALRPSVLGPAGTAVTVQSDQSVLNQFVGSVGSILWIDGGKIEITAIDSWGYTATGTIIEPLNGIPGPGGAQVPYWVSPANWMWATPTNVITVPAVFAGQTLSVYADLAYVGDFLVPPSLTITLPATASRIVAGFPMSSSWQSLKLAYGAQKGTAVLQKKKVIQLGLILDKTGDGLQAGADFNNLDPVEIEVADDDQDTAPSFFTGEINVPFDGEFDTDPRICLRVDGPQPCTIIGYVANVQTCER